MSCVARIPRGSPVKSTQIKQHKLFELRFWNSKRNKQQVVEYQIFPQKSTEEEENYKTLLLLSKYLNILIKMWLLSKWGYGRLEPWGVREGPREMAVLKKAWGERTWHLKGGKVPGCRLRGTRNRNRGQNGKEQDAVGCTLPGMRAVFSPTLCPAAILNNRQFR